MDKPTAEVKPFRILITEQMVGVWNYRGSGCTVCKQSAPHFKETTMPTSHH